MGPQDKNGPARRLRQHRGERPEGRPVAGRQPAVEGATVPSTSQCSARAAAADLRLRAMDVGYVDAQGTVRAMRRGAEEIDRLLDEAYYLRAAVEALDGDGRSE